MTPTPRHVPRVLLIIGTRPEAIKLAPLAHALAEDGRLAPCLLTTGQQASSVRRVLAAEGLSAATLPAVRAPNWRAAAWRLAAALRPRLAALMPAAVLVQGDTLSAYAGARAAKSLGLPLGHVEAGLRSPDPADPFPEDLLRRRIAVLADWHFAPTAAALRHLQHEQAAGRVSGRLLEVGSTALDALRRRPPAPAEPGFNLLVTLHRRENQGVVLANLVAALGELLRQRPALRIAWLLHPRADWAARVGAALDCLPAVLRLPAQPQSRFLALARGAGRVLSDSGGLQEELPVLGVGQLVLRRCSERPEGLGSGHAALCDPRRADLAAGIAEWLDRHQPAPLRPGIDCPWGDGFAAERIVAQLGADLCAAPARRAHG